MQFMHLTGSDNIYLDTFLNNLGIRSLIIVLCFFVLYICKVTDNYKSCKLLLIYCLLHKNSLHIIIFCAQFLCSIYFIIQ